MPKVSPKSPVRPRSKKSPQPDPLASLTDSERAAVLEIDHFVEQLRRQGHTDNRIYQRLTERGGLAVINWRGCRPEVAAQLRSDWERMHPNP